MPDYGSVVEDINPFDVWTTPKTVNVGGWISGELLHGHAWPVTVVCWDHSIWTDEGAPTIGGSLGSLVTGRWMSGALMHGIAYPVNAIRTPNPLGSRFT